MGSQPETASQVKPTENQDSTGQRKQEPDSEPDSEMERIKKGLLDPRTISKGVDPEGRTKTARAILEARASSRSKSERVVAGEQKLREIADLTTSLYEQEREIEKRLKQRLESFLVKLRIAVGIGDEQIERLQREIEEIKSQRDTLMRKSLLLKGI